MNIKIKNILNVFIENGYEAYIVGGFVRDYLLGKETYDVDIATNALPKDVRRIFGLSSSTQENYGSTMFKDKLYNYDITTYRKEGHYENRRPVEFEFTDDIKQDIIRRDFTINSLYMDINGKIYDNVNGIEDIESKIIRSIGSIEDKMIEDPLRILRAIRFAATLNFTIDDKIINYIRQNKQLLNTLSVNRKKEELDKIFSCENQLYGIQLIKKLGIEKELDLVIPDDIKGCQSSYGIWAQLEIGEGYQFSNNDKKIISNIKKIIKYGEIDNIVLYECGIFSCTLAADILNISRMNVSEQYKELPIYSMKDIKITGDDIIKILGIEPGEKIKQILADIEINILDGTLINEYDILKTYINNNWR